MVYKKTLYGKHLENILMYKANVNRRVPISTKISSRINFEI